MESQVDADIPISSAPVVMLSPPPPDTQDGPQDIFHTQPEESLLPSSDIDVPPCTLNQAVDIDAGSQVFVELAALSDSSEFVDFGKDSELGFSQDAHLKNEIDADSVSGNRSHGFRVLEKGVSDFGESPVKKLKLGFGEDVLPQSNGVSGEHVNDDSCREIQMGGNLISKEDVEMECLVPEENVEPEVVQNDVDVNLIMGTKNNSNEIGEGSGTREDLEEAAANRLRPGRVERDKRQLVFDVLRVLTDEQNAKKNENETKGRTLLETAMLSGVTFPRPSWLSADRKSEIFKFDDEVEK
jgi:hypothetical protein